MMKIGRTSARVRILTTIAATLMMPVAASAQAKAAAPATAAAAAACRFAMTDDWVKRQVEFFDDAKPTWSDNQFRLDLLAAAGLTVPLTMPIQRGTEIEGLSRPLGPSAQAMRDRLLKLAAVKGSTWPTRSVVGGAGTHAVYLLSLGDTALGRAALKHMMEAGPAESPAADVATFEDHMRLVWGRKQLYGTQFRIAPNGAITLAPMEDSAHADMRREGAGLPPFALGLCMAREAAK
jgi:hypothetical protein